MQKLYPVFDALHHSELVYPHVVHMAGARWHAQQAPQIGSSCRWLIPCMTSRATVAAAAGAASPSAASSSNPAAPTAPAATAPTTPTAPTGVSGQGGQAGTTGGTGGAGGDVTSG